MAQFSGCCCFSEKREILAEWAHEEGVTVTQLCGYFQYLENWMSDKKTATVGWRIFTGETINQKPELTLQEATWIIEKCSMSQHVYQEIRLLLLDRIRLPPVILVRQENKQHRPDLILYRHGVKAPLGQCLSLTISEHIQQLDILKLDS